MATFRVGVGSFNINDGAVGIGTEGSGHGKLKVEGTTRTSAVDVVGGASTFTRYSGFSANEISVNDRFGATNPAENKDKGDKTNVRTLELTGETQTTGDIIVDDRTVLKVGLGSTACIGSLEYVCVKNHFSVPTGGTNQRNSSVYVEGTIRYNTDLGTMEFFNGNEWRQFTYIADIQNSISTMGRAVLMGGSNPETDIKFFQIMTLGSCDDFGDLIENHQYAAASGSKTRGIIAGGYSAPDSGYSQPRIEYITMASKGDGITFGELSAGHFRNSGGCSSSTRGLFFGGGYPSYYNSIEYVELDTLGDALDFGDLTSSNMIKSCCASPTRAFCLGGYNPSNDLKLNHEINMVTISSKGNAVRFGDPVQQTYGMAGCSNHVRAIFAGGYFSPSVTNSTKIQYFTMASEGNATVFGDLNIGSDNPAGNSNQVRGVISGGYVSPTGTNRMEFITITTTGAAQDFGDLTNTDFRSQGTSDSHGGLGGY